LETVQLTEQSEPKAWVENVVRIKRCATVVKGGRRFSFRVIVVVGDKDGTVGWGFGKANEVSPAVEKSVKDARGNLRKISRKGTTIPHEVIGRYGASRVVLLPASSGTGVIAGSAVRAVVEAAGISDILTKSLGSNNPFNLVKAAMDGLLKLRTVHQVEQLRGVRIR